MVACWCSASLDKHQPNSSSAELIITEELHPEAYDIVADPTAIANYTFALFALYFLAAFADDPKVHNIVGATNDFFATFTFAFYNDPIAFDLFTAIAFDLFAAIASDLYDANADNLSFLIACLAASATSVCFS